MTGITTSLPRSMYPFVIKHHSYRAFANLGRMPFRCLANDGSTLSGVGASGKPVTDNARQHGRGQNVKSDYSALHGPQNRSGLGGVSAARSNRRSSERVNITERNAALNNRPVRASLRINEWRTLGNRPENSTSELLAVSATFRSPAKNVAGALANDVGGQRAFRPVQSHLGARDRPRVVQAGR